MMKVSDKPTKVFDEVILEIRSIKHGISERHGHDIDRLLSSLMSQEIESGAAAAGIETDPSERIN